MRNPKVEFARPGFVSVWVGEFPTPEAADAYFTERFDPPELPHGEPYWEPSPFQAELGLGFYPPWKLETRFPEQPLPVGELLADITFTESFGPLVVEQASRKGIDRAGGVAVVFGFDYRLKPGWAEAVGPVRFVGTFPFAFRQPKDVQPVEAAAAKAGLAAGAVEVVCALLNDCKKLKGPGAGHITARELCDHALGNQPEWAIPLLRAFGMETSEKFGRAVMRLVEAGLLRKSEKDSEADFAGLFDLRTLPT